MLHKTKPLALISEGNIKEALDLLDQMLIHGRHYPDLVHFKARYTQMRRNATKGILSGSEESRDTNILVDHLIEFISQIEEREFLNQILLVSPDQAAHKFVADQLRLLFPNVVEDYSGKKVEGDFAFVVINDLHTAPAMVEHFDSLIDYYAQKYYLVVATPGMGKAVVNQHRPKIHAANSVIALPARIREMMDFVRYFKPA